MFDKKAYLNFADRIKSVLVDISDELLKTPVDDGKWSSYQLLQHIVDSEIVYFRRIKRTLVEDNPQLLPWHPTAWIELESDSIEVDVNVSIIRNIRKKLIAILSKDPNWDRKVTHPRYGQLTLKSLIEQQIDHAEGHLQSIITFMKQA